MYASVGDTVNYHLPFVTDLLGRKGKVAQSRNGEVIVFNAPLTVVTQRPWLRTLLCPARKNNPFVDFFDGLFVLAGTKTLKFLTGLNQRFVNYTEYDGKLHGQYSHRILNHFGYNQLYVATEKLFRDFNDRRAVIQLYDPVEDHFSHIQDIPCNISALPTVRDGNLDLTVINRSNDIYWGMLGVNIVQFSMLQEIMAYLVGVPMGKLYQISNNAHAYTGFGPYKTLGNPVETERCSEESFPLIAPDPKASFAERTIVVNAFLRTLTHCWNRAYFADCENSEFTFLRDVVHPMWRAAVDPYSSSIYIADPNWRRAVEIYREHQ